MNDSDYNLDFDVTDFDSGDDLESFESSMSLGDMLAEELGISGMDFSESSDYDISFDSSDYGFDSEGEEGSLDLEGAAEVLRSYADVSVDLVSYYEMTLNALQKLFAMDEVSNIKGLRPPITDFSYIADDNKRQQVYGFFCQMLEDLTQDKSYSDLTEDQAYSAMLEELYTDLHWTPYIYEEKFRQTFHGYYDNNKKLAHATSSTKSTSVIGLLDRTLLQQSELAFRVNSLPFHIVTNFFTDASVLHSPNARLDEEDLGDLAMDIKQKLGVKYLTCQNAYDGIIQFLYSNETLTVLNLAEAERTDFKTGELFRRFVLTELMDGTFYLTNIQNLPVNNINAVIEVLVKTVYNAIRQHSIAAELIFLTLLLMQTTKNIGDFFRPFAEGIAQYLSVFSNNRAFVNPVFYTLIDYAENSDSDNCFQITYTCKEQVVTENIEGILCEVVGDTNTIYRVPLIHINSTDECVVCPPKEVVDSLISVTRDARMNVNGSVRYRFTPTYSWLSTLNITASGRPDRVITTEGASVHVNNPLLSTLLEYDNDFDTSGEEPTVVGIHGKGIKSLLGVDLKQKEDRGISISQLLFEDNSEGTAGVFFKDPEDGSVVIRYTDSSTQVEDVLVINENEYEELVYTSDSISSNPQDYNLSLLGIESVAIPPIETEPYLKAVVQHLCSLTALDYNQLLEDAREVIVRDLNTVIHYTFLDELLGYKVLSLYLEKIEKEGNKLNLFNLHTLKEILDFTLGVPNFLTGEKEFKEEHVTELKKVLADRESEIISDFSRFKKLDMHILAFQAVSSSELVRGDRLMYNAFHCVPSVHAILRSLEDRMIILRILREIGDEIIPILMKNHSAMDVYKSLCTKDTVYAVEKDLALGMKEKGKECLKGTKAILNNTQSENCVILKYFLLERNPYGVLTSLEECMSADDTGRYADLYYKLKNDLHLSEYSEIASLDEMKVRSLCSRKLVGRVFNTYEDEIMSMIYDGLITDVSHNVNLQIIKSYDIITSFGAKIFNLQHNRIEDFSDISAFQSDFYSYVGSFLVSYSPVSGESEDEIDGGIDRAMTYVKHPSDFVVDTIVENLRDYTIVDLHQVEGADGSDVFLDNAVDGDAE